MKSTKKKEGITNKEGSVWKNGQNWTEDQLANFRSYQQEFIKASYRTFTYRANRQTEQKLIQYCESQSNFSGMLGKLIKKDMLSKGILPDGYFTFEDAKADLLFSSDLDETTMNAEDCKLSSLIVLKLDKKSPAIDEELEESILLGFLKAMERFPIITQDLEFEERYLRFKLSYSPDFGLNSIVSALTTHLSDFLNSELQGKIEVPIFEKCYYASSIGTKNENQINKFIHP